MRVHDATDTEIEDRLHRGEYRQRPGQPGGDGRRHEVRDRRPIAKQTPMREAKTLGALSIPRAGMRSVLATVRPFRLPAA